VRARLVGQDVGHNPRRAISGSTSAIAHKPDGNRRLFAAGLVKQLHCLVDD
jgi:hypothetical protein